MKPVEWFPSLVDTDSETEWCHRFFGVAARLGFDSALLAIVPQPQMALEEAYMRSSYRSAWRSWYYQNHLARIDPTVSHCLTRTTGLIWSREVFRTREQQHLYEEASYFGLRSGVALPIHGPRGEVGMLCLVRDSRPGPAFEREVAERLPELSLLRDVVFDAAVGFASPARQPTEPVPQLTARERECLQWAAVGKSTWEIARIIRRSESVVNYHFANIRAKFDVTTRRAAIVKAIRCGLISPDI